MIAGLLEVQAMQEKDEVSVVSKDAVQEMSSQTNGLTSQKLDMMSELNVKATEWTVDFEAGQKESNITVEILEDDEPEYNEEFFLVLKSKDNLGENDLISKGSKNFRCCKTGTYVSPSCWK